MQKALSSPEIYVLRAHAEQLLQHCIGGESQKRMLVTSIFNAFKLRGPRAAGVLHAASSSSETALGSTGVLSRAV